MRFPSLSVVGFRVTSTASIFVGSRVVEWSNVQEPEMNVKYSLSLAYLSPFKLQLSKYILTVQCVKREGTTVSEG